MLGQYARLFVGLWLFGATIALLLRAGLGVMPWDVLHDGLSRSLGWSFGTVVILIGALVLALWIPLKVRPGPGTIANVIVVGISADVTLAMVDPVSDPRARVAMMAAGIIGNAFATALYVNAGLGAGPRDGLWVGLVALTGLSVRVIRTATEGIVVGTGFVLGGDVGWATLLFALTIGPLVQMFLRLTDGRPGGPS